VRVRGGCKCGANSPPFDAFFFFPAAAEFFGRFLFFSKGMLATLPRYSCMPFSFFGPSAGVRFSFSLGQRLWRLQKFRVLSTNMSFSSPPHQPSHCGFSYVVKGHPQAGTATFPAIRFFLVGPPLRSRSRSAESSASRCGLLYSNVFFFWHGRLPFPPLFSPRPNT